VARDARSVVPKRDPAPVQHAVDLDVRPAERVGLPEFVGVRLGEGQADVIQALRVRLEAVHVV